MTMRRSLAAAPIAVAGVCALLALIWVSPAAAATAASPGLEEDLQSLGLWGPFAIVGLRFGSSLLGVVPTSPLLLAAGASEGIWLGSFYVLVGAQLGALAGFLIGRRLGRGFVERHGWVEKVGKTRAGRWLLDENTSQSQLMAAVFLCRLIPGLNMDALSYVAGVTPLSTWRFFLASLAALLPYTVLVVAAGQQLVTFGPGTTLLVIGGVLAFSVVVALGKRYWPVRQPPEKPVLPR